MFGVIKIIHLLAPDFNLPQHNQYNGIGGWKYLAFASFNIIDSFFSVGVFGFSCTFLNIAASLEEIAALVLLSKKCDWLKIISTEILPVVLRIVP